MTYGLSSHSYIYTVLETSIRIVITIVVFNDYRLMKEDAPDESQEELNTVPAEGFAAIYQTVEEGWLRAPVRYIHFIKAYHHILTHKRRTLLQRKNMLAVSYPLPTYRLLFKVKLSHRNRYNVLLLGSRGRATISILINWTDRNSRHLTEAFLVSSKVDGRLQP